MKALEKFKLLDPAESTLPLLVFDIKTTRIMETLPIEGPYYDVWEQKRESEGEFEYEQLALSFNNEASLFAPFCKVVAVSFGFYRGGDNYIKSFYGDDEKELLQNLHTFLTSETVTKSFSLSGFALGYDVPVLVKRFLHNGIEVPAILDNSNRKPWEVDMYDLMKIMKMDGFYNESLLSTCLLLNVPAPNTDGLTSKEIANIYYSSNKKTKKGAEKEMEAKLQLVSRYCNEDVHATINCFLKLLSWDIVETYTQK
jgi:hypothetical protein